VANDYYASEDHRFHIITGCNMSGKSTYIRIIALLQVVAQIGCFVPADYACFSIRDNIFSRISTDDNIEENLSTFAVEMREVGFILRYINDILAPTMISDSCADIPLAQEHHAKEPRHNRRAWPWHQHPGRHRHRIGCSRGTPAEQCNHLLCHALL
jgi:hypothetical protein